MIIVVVLSEIIAWKGNFLGYSKTYPNGIPSSEIINPPTAAFLSGNSSGQYLQILLIWFMPLFLILINIQRALEKGKTNGHYIDYLRLDNLNKGMLKNELTNFGIFSLFFTTLFGLDFILAIILFHRGTSFMGMESAASDSHLLRLEINHPYLTYILFILVVSMAFGLYSVVTYVLALAVKKMVLVYPLSLGLWFLMIAMPHSESYFTQPFIEYDWNDYFLSLSWFLGICAFVIIAGNMFIKFRSKYVYFE